MLLQLPDFDPSIAEEFGYQITSCPTFLGVPLMETQSLLHLLIRFSFNLLVSWIIVQFFYYPKSGRRRDYYLTFMAFATAMFLLIFLMESVKLQIGLTLGLFAIFGVIRYRTETVPVREMTYLFIIITASVINGLALNISYAELVLANALLIGLIAALEYAKKKPATSVKIVLYDKIANIVPERKDDLIADLKERLGLDIVDVEVGHVDFLKDSAYVKVTYLPADGKPNNIDRITKAKDFPENWN